MLPAVGGLAMTLLVQDFLGACVAGYVGNRADYLST